MNASPFWKRICVSVSAIKKLYGLFRHVIVYGTEAVKHVYGCYVAYFIYILYVSEKYQKY